MDSRHRTESLLSLSSGGYGKQELCFEFWRKLAPDPLARLDEAKFRAHPPLMRASVVTSLHHSDQRQREPCPTDTRTVANIHQFSGKENRQNVTKEDSEPCAELS